MEKALLQKALGLSSSRYPIWFLRQAGRYLPEYRQLREQHDFLELCMQPHLAAEITMQPLKRFDLDGAIVFSDILIPAVALGQKLTFEKDHGPILSDTVTSSKDLTKLRSRTCHQYWNFVGEAISLVKSRLAPHQTMIGFAGAPFTLGTYMIEGGGSKSLLATKKFAFCDREGFKSFLSLLSEITTNYLQMQIDAGAEVLMLFDSWAHQISSEDYRELALPAVKSIVEKISPQVPLIYYPGQSGDRLYDLEGLEKVVIAVDWRVPLIRAQHILSTQNLRPIIQGNLDPVVLNGNEDFVRERVRAILTEAKHAELKGHIFNVGHGLLPSTPISALHWVIDELRQWPVLS